MDPAGSGSAPYFYLHHDIATNSCPPLKRSIKREQSDEIAFQISYLLLTGLDGLSGHLSSHSGRRKIRQSVRNANLINRKGF